MENEKELKLNEPENPEENINSLEKTEETAEQLPDEKVSDFVAEKMEQSKSYTKSELDEELERLTEAFREELKKQRGNDNFDAEYELIQQLEEEDKKENYIAEEDLCLCCGVQKRNYARGESYQYCEDCRNAMKKYPFSVHHFIFLAVAVIIAVLSVASFSNEFNGYKKLYEARQFEKEGKITSAVIAYDEAVTEFTDNTNGKNLNCKKIYLKMADNIYRAMPSGANSLRDVAGLIEKGLSSFEATLPLYESYVDMYNECRIMEATYSKIIELAQSEKYATFTSEDLTLYDDMMADIEAMLSETVTVTAVNNSKEITEYPCSSSMIRYFQYLLAYSCGKSEDAYNYLCAAKEADEGAVWMYGYDLGTMEIQNGNVNEAFTYVKNLKAVDIENAYAYILEAFAYRMNGEYNKSLKACENGLKTAGDAPDLYRQKAMTLILDGKFSEAEEACKKGLEKEEYGAMYFVYLIAATEQKDTDAVKSINSSLKEMGVEYTEKMQKYVDGKITYKDVLLKGTGDIE